MSTANLNAKPLSTTRTRFGECDAQVSLDQILHCVGVEGGIGRKYLLDNREIETRVR